MYHTNHPFFCKWVLVCHCTHGKVKESVLTSQVEHLKTANNDHDSFFGKWIEEDSLLIKDFLSTNYKE